MSPLTFKRFRKSLAVDVMLKHLLTQAGLFRDGGIFICYAKYAV